MKIIARFIPAFLVAVIIAVFSLIENPDYGLLRDCGDKLLHALSYVGLSITLISGFLLGGRSNWRFYVASFVLSSVYGGIMEILQMYVTVSRTGSWLDWVADIIGSTIGLLVVYIAYRVCLNKSYTK